MTTPTAPALTPLIRRLVDLIDADGRSAAEIARAASLSPQYLSDLRRGVRGDRMTAEVLADLCRALGVRATDFGRMVYDCHPEKISWKNPQ